MMFHTIDHLNKLDIQGIKLQLLHILKGTDLAAVYEKTHFHVPDMEEYIELLGSCIAKLRPDIIVHRLTGDGYLKNFLSRRYGQAQNEPS